MDFRVILFLKQIFCAKFAKFCKVLQIFCSRENSGGNSAPGIFMILHDPGARDATPRGGAAPFACVPATSLPLHTRVRTRPRNASNRTLRAEAPERTCFVLIIYLEADVQNTNFARRRAISRRCAHPADLRCKCTKRHAKRPHRHGGRASRRFPRHAVASRGLPRSSAGSARKGTRKERTATAPALRAGATVLAPSSLGCSSRPSFAPPARYRAESAQK